MFKIINLEFVNDSDNCEKCSNYMNDCNKCNSKTECL